LAGTSDLIVLIGVGILGGYGSGMGKRYSARIPLVSGQLLEQYQLGIQAVNMGQYAVAKAFRIYHPELSKLSWREKRLYGSAPAYDDYSTVVPLQLRLLLQHQTRASIDQIYADVKGLSLHLVQIYVHVKWGDIITKLDTLRKDDITYHAAEVDGMYYIALRNRVYARSILKRMSQTRLARVSI